jgi:hypothetical protein
MVDLLVWDLVDASWTDDIRLDELRLSPLDRSSSKSLPVNIRSQTNELIAYPIDRIRMRRIRVGRIEPFDLSSEPNRFPN